MGAMPISGKTQRRLAIRLARDAGDRLAVQRLRWKVFFEEMGAAAVASAATHIDSDAYDDLCDHLLVIDEDIVGDESVVGTYRLLRESVAMAAEGFYSDGEFDLSSLTTGEGRPRGELLELGRSCVLPAYRTSATISLLWRGIADYIARHDIGLMFGCASFHGTNPDDHAAALSLLAHNHLAPPTQRPVVRDGVARERLPRGSDDERRALLSLPPLVKGYLRAGARFGDGAFVDEAFNTVDVCVVMPVELIAARYNARFSAAA